MRFSDFDAYLLADHLQHSTTVTIERFEKITTHPRPGRTEMALAVRFKGKQKPLILSTLNRRKLASMFGSVLKSVLLAGFLRLADENKVVCVTDRFAIRESDNELQ